MQGVDCRALSFSVETGWGEGTSLLCQIVTHVASQTRWRSLYWLAQHCCYFCFYMVQAKAEHPLKEPTRLMGYHIITKVVLLPAVGGFR